MVDGTHFFMIRIPKEFRYLHSRIRKVFEQRFHLKAPKENIVFYLHNDSTQSRRVWLNGRAIQKRLAQKPGWNTEIKVIDGFHGTSFEEQCRLFNDAKVVIASHGAHQSNYICAHKGALMVEVGCPQDTGYWSTELMAETFFKPMGVDYIHLWVDKKDESGKAIGRCDKERRYETDSFEFDYNVIKETIRKAFH